MKNIFQLVLSTIVLIGLTSFAANAQTTVTYDIPASAFLNMETPAAFCDSGTEIGYDGVGSNNPLLGVAFTWESTGMGVAPSAIKVELFTDYASDRGLGGPYSYRINDVYRGNAPSYPVFDTDCANAPMIETFDFVALASDDYTVGGMNTLYIQATPLDYWTLAQNPDWNNGYARMTVTYPDGVVTPVPTMGEWALITFGLIIMSMGVITVRRREEEMDLQAAS